MEGTFVIKFIRWFLSPSPKEIVCETDVYSKLVELEDRIAKLEEENVETTNTLYELMNSIDAVDTRIDILTVEKWTEKNV